MLHLAPVPEAGGPTRSRAGSAAPELVLVEKEQLMVFQKTQEACRFELLMYSKAGKTGTLQIGLPEPL